MLPSELTNNIEHFTVYVHRNEAHFTYIYVHHTNVFEADNIYKNPPPNVISSIIILFAIFISLWGSTHDSADCWSAHRSPAVRDNFKRARLMHGWVESAGWPLPQTKIMDKPVDVSWGHSIFRVREARNSRASASVSRS